MKSLTSYYHETPKFSCSSQFIRHPPASLAGLPAEVVVEIIKNFSDLNDLDAIMRTCAYMLEICLNIVPANAIWAIHDRSAPFCHPEKRLWGIDPYFSGRYWNLRVWLATRVYKSQIRYLECSVRYLRSSRYCECLSCCWVSLTSVRDNPIHYSISRLLAWDGEAKADKYTKQAVTRKQTAKLSSHTLDRDLKRKDTAKSSSSEDTHSSIVLPPVPLYAIGLDATTYSFSEAWVQACDAWARVIDGRVESDDQAGEDQNDKVARGRMNDPASMNAFSTILFHVSIFMMCIDCVYILGDYLVAVAC